MSDRFERHGGGGDDVVASGRLGARATAPAGAKEIGEEVGRIEACPPAAGRLIAEVKLEMLIAAGRAAAWAPTARKAAGATRLAEPSKPVKRGFPSGPISPLSNCAFFVSSPTIS